MAAASAAPTSSGERHHILDALRGWALLGVLLANMAGFIGFGMLNEQQRTAALASGFDDLAELFLEWLVVGKFYSLFSLLFGIGFAVQLARLEERGEGIGRYVRRLALLFLFGVAHLLLLWFGDILALYALMGGVLLLFRRCADRTLVAWAIGLWLLPIIWAALIAFAGFAPGKPFYDIGMVSLAAFGIDPTLSPSDFYRDNGFVGHLRAHPPEVFFRVGDLVHQLRPAKVLAMFLLGLLIGRRRIFADLEGNRSLLRRTAWIGLGLGLPLSFARAILTMTAGDNSLLGFMEEAVYCLSTPTLALGYAALFALAWNRKGAGLAAWPAPAGRMALTNYIGQTIIQSLIFYGWGLAMIGRFGLVFIYPIGLAVFAAQVAFSAWWLARYRFGPLEWLRRSGTYGRAQPMQRARPEVLAA